ncbi:tRNA preQ1(34) S-adenosylmethionine ribosyltransferase-isomerase QueA [Alicyclobacillaceae bacterium I2511]|nr:tRNA preQ1(34) S-adenosylmethionine ribosyltransferase-isomerase QueA [Alicyclobacillaceae bacterium I2511]
MQVEEFNYELPVELIAQTPLSERTASRLMVVDPVTRTWEHRGFQDLPQYLCAGDVLVLNNSRVLRARLYGIKLDTGARVEVLLARPVNEDDWWVMAKPAKRLHLNTELEFYPAAKQPINAEEHPDAFLQPGRTVKSIPLKHPRARVISVGEEGRRLLHFDLPTGLEFPMFLEEFGEVPLPPYIHSPLQDANRYQTVYAQPPGSVAAPTAGLHFSHTLLSHLADMGVDLEFVTLHVGAGTFKPVQTTRVEEHLMHQEIYEVTEAVAEKINRARIQGRRVIAVGTTALRTLESAAGSDGRVQSGRRETGIFIYPGYSFRVIDGLITNFHLPKSTLLMLVAALAGVKFTHQVYREAVAQRYRFFSFGDAMFIERGLSAVE